MGKIQLKIEEKEGVHAAGTTIALEGATHREALGQENARPFQFGSSPDQSALGSGPSASNGGSHAKAGVILMSSGFVTILRTFSRI